MNNKIIIKVEGQGITHTIELCEDISPEELIECFCKLAESLSFMPGQIRDELRTALANRVYFEYQSLQRSAQFCANLNER